jgi:hypothetical protein
MNTAQSGVRSNINAHSLDRLAYSSGLVDILAEWTD